MKNLTLFILRVDWNAGVPDKYNEIRGKNLMFWPLNAATAETNLSVQPDENCYSSMDNVLISANRHPRENAFKWPDSRAGHLQRVSSIKVEIQVIYRGPCRDSSKTGDLQTDLQKLVIWVYSGSR